MSGAENPNSGQVNTTPQQIEEAVKAQARAMGCGNALTAISGQAQQLLTGLCAGNPRLALAVASELKLFYEEVLRQSIVINKTPPAQPATDTPQTELAAKAQEYLDEDSGEDKPVVGEGTQDTQMEDNLSGDTQEAS